MAEITQEQVEALRALGEAAIRHDEACKRYDALDELEDTSPEHDARQDELDRSTAEVLQAARLYAQSIKGEDHG